MAEELLIECEFGYLLFGCRVAFAAAHGRFTVQQKARWHLLGTVLCRVQRTKLGEELLISLHGEGSQLTLSWERT